jgi:nucleoside-diphosphate-sugar epimerase
MAGARYLVTGAGGRVGATGNHAVRQFIARGLPVRALVHRIDARSELLRILGAEVIAGDLCDLETVRKAMQGVPASGPRIFGRRSSWTI